MKCLEDYTIEQVEEMSREELSVVWNEMVEEKREVDRRHTIISLINVMEAEKPLIEN